MRTDGALAVAKGIATYIPGLYALLGQRNMNRKETIVPEYPYGVWMKHLTLMNKTVACGVPEVVVELGPGDTLGVGVSALLSGSQKFIGIDERSFASNRLADACAKGLVDLFELRSGVNVRGWPDFRSTLDADGFPSSLLTSAALKRSLNRSRVAAILNDVEAVSAGVSNSTPSIDYFAPVSTSSVANGSVDFVLSHSVLEHVVDLRATLQSAFRWLKPGGYMSHQFDLDSHNIVRAWDGHRAFSAGVWKLIVGRRPFMINRIPFSTIVDEIRDVGFDILLAERQFKDPTLPRDALRPPWTDVSDDDVQTCGGFIQARKPTTQ